LYNKLKAAGREIADRYSGTMDYFYLTPASLSLIKPLMPVFEKYARGNLLDAGAGRLSYRFLLERYCSSYRSVDIDVRGASVDAMGDVQRLPVKDGSFDTAFCTQVLEHVREPVDAMKEIHRVLKRGGHAIFTVPHLGYLHNEPNDYYRVTRHGLQYMMEKSGFQVERIIPAGGLLSFLGHIPSTLCMNLTDRYRFINRWMFVLNRLFVKTLVFMDEHLERKKIYALNYIAVGRKG